jgi:hypothetical protein
MTYAPSWPRRKSAIGTLRANALGSKGRHDRSSASVSETNPTTRCSSSWSVASRSVTDRPQRSSRHTSTRSSSRRRAASSIFSRASRRAAPELTSRTCRQSSSPAGRHTPAWPDAALPAFAGHWWKHGRKGPHEAFSPAFVPGQKRYRILPSEMPVWRAFRSITQTMAAVDPFRPGRPHHITRPRPSRVVPASRGSSMASTSRGSASVPRHAAATR